jgi:hypothetical protein
MLHRHMRMAHMPLCACDSVRQAILYSAEVLGRRRHARTLEGTSYHGSAAPVPWSRQVRLGTVCFTGICVPRMGALAHSEGASYRGSAGLGPANHASGTVCFTGICAWRIFLSALAIRPSGDSLLGGGTRPPTSRSDIRGHELSRLRRPQTRQVSLGTACFTGICVPRLAYSEGTSSRLGWPQHPGANSASVRYASRAYAYRAWRARSHTPRARAHGSAGPSTQAPTPPRYGMLHRHMLTAHGRARSHTPRARAHGSAGPSTQAPTPPRYGMLHGHMLTAHGRARSHTPRARAHGSAGPSTWAPTPPRYGMLHRHMRTAHMPPVLAIRPVSHALLGGGARRRCSAEVLGGGARRRCSAEVLGGGARRRCSAEVLGRRRCPLECVRAAS